MSNYEIDLPNIKTSPEDKGPQNDLKKKIIEALMLFKQKTQVISQLKQADPQAYQAVIKMIQALTDIAQQKLVKMSEFAVEESSEGSPEFFEQSHSEPEEPVKKEKIDGTAEDDFWDDVASSLTPEELKDV